MGVMGILERALDIRAFYHQVLSGNIANVETPNYKEKDIDFHGELDRKMRGATEIEVKEKADYDGITGLDGNTVNIESQIIKLTENSLMFNSLVQVVGKKFSLMRYLINEGRR